MAGKVSKELLAMVSDFLVSEVSKNIIYGITYNFVFKADYIRKTFGKAKGESLAQQSEADKERYDAIRREATACGFNPTEVIRVYEVNNGYIYDLDLSLAKIVTMDIAKKVASRTGEEIPNGDFIGTRPEQSREQSMASLSKKIKKMHEKGVNEIEVALFSRNVTPRIVINGFNEAKEPVAMIYDAYYLKHTDIEVLNANYLVPNGITVYRVTPCEILKSKTGIRCKLFFDTIENTGRA